MELKKYDIFMDELIELEKTVYRLVQREDEIFEEKQILVRELKSIKDENEILKIKLEDAESRKNTFGENSTEFDFDSDDKKITKKRIDELINKIDNHLRS